MLCYVVCKLTAVVQYIARWLTLVRAFMNCTLILIQFH